MDNREKAMLERLGLSEADTQPKPTTIEITREDFDLLDIEDDVTYHIIEADGRITFKKGVNR